MSNSQHRAFHGKSVAEAMSKVRSALGKDAYIIEKREVKKKNFFKLGGGEEIVQIIASKTPGVVNDVTPQHRPQTTTKRGTLLEKTYGTIGNKTQTTLNDISTQQTATTVNTQHKEVFAHESTSAATGNTRARNNIEEAILSHTSLDSITDILAQKMHDEVLRMTSIQARGAIPEVGETLLDCYQQLIENEVNANSARTIVEKLQRDIPFTTLTRENINQYVSEEISKHIHVSKSVNLSRINNRPAIISIVGPNGSGKTTTITKLAFEAVIKHKKKVGLITEDIKRPGAEAQLRSLTNIMQVPLVSVSSATNMAEEIHNMKDMDLILIDTGGISHRDNQSIEELREMLRVACVDEVHLMLPVSITERTAMALIESYKPINYNRIIFSKIDEAAAYGMILNIANKVSTDISYITCGCACTTGLYQASPDKLAQLVTEGYIEEIIDDGKPSD